MRLMPENWLQLFSTDHVQVTWIHHAFGDASSRCL